MLALVLYIPAAWLLGGGLSFVAVAVVAITASFLCYKYCKCKRKDATSCKFHTIVLSRKEITLHNCVKILLYLKHTVLYRIAEAVMQETLRCIIHIHVLQTSRLLVYQMSRDKTW